MTILKNAENFAKKEYSKNTAEPDLFEHAQLVRKFCIELAKIEKADQLVLEIAGLLHDTGRLLGSAGHAERSRVIAKKFLEKIELSKERKELVLECILKHSEVDESKKNIEVEIIRSADGLALLYQDKNKLTKEEIISYIDKADKKIKLKSAKLIAERRIKELKMSLNLFY